MKKKRNKRLLITFTLITAIFSVLVVNVFIVSVKGYHINSKTDIKHEVEDIHTIYDPIIAKRGRILDYQHNVLVEDKQAFTLYAYVAEDRFDGVDPAYVTDKEAAAPIIAEVLGLDEAFVLDQLSADAKQVEFGIAGKYITTVQKEALENSGILGLGYAPVLIRGHYSTSLGSTLIGMTSFNEELNRQEGIMGVEKYYDDILTGKNGVEVYRQDRDMYRFDSIEQFTVEAENGKDIRLSIDKIVQGALDKALNNIIENQRVLAKEAWGALVDIETGRILAIADAPSFDAEDPNTLYLNRATEYQYEPGSTMKTLTYAMALNEKGINPQDTFDSSPFYIYVDEDGVGQRVSSSANYSAVIHNPFRENYGIISMVEGYQRSSNVMIAQIMSDYLIKEAFPRYMRALGFYENVNIGKLPEASGIEVWEHYHEKLTNGFGQGSTVGMLQLLQAHTAVFGDGSVVKPYIIEEIINPNTQEVEYKAEVNKSEPVFTKETAQLVRDAMYDNVQNQTFGMERFKMDEISVMAKSGTSEIVIDGVYSSDEYIFSAMLGFPYENPKYAFYFAYRTFDNHPFTQVANEMKNVIKTVIANYPIDTTEKEDTETPVHKFQLKNYVNKDVSQVKEALKLEGIDPVVIGDGTTVIQQYPQRNTTILNNEKILLNTNSTQKLLPDMSGWSVKEVMTLSEFMNIEIEIEGSGFVKSQSIPANTALQNQETIKVILE